MPHMVTLHVMPLSFCLKPAFPSSGGLYLGPLLADSRKSLLELRRSRCDLFHVRDIEIILFIVLLISVGMGKSVVDVGQGNSITDGG